MNYEFLAGIMILGILLGIIGFIAALRERRRMRSRLGAHRSPKSPVRGAVYVVHGSIRPELLAKAMERASRSRPNRVVATQPRPHHLNTVYDAILQDVSRWGKSRPPTAKS